MKTTVIGTRYLMIAKNCSRSLNEEIGELETHELHHGTDDRVWRLRLVLAAVLALRSGKTSEFRSDIFLFRVVDVVQCVKTVRIRLFKLQIIYLVI